MCVYVCLSVAFGKNDQPGELETYFELHLAKCRQWVVNIIPRLCCMLGFQGRKVHEFNNNISSLKSLNRKITSYTVIFVLYGSAQPL